MKKRLLSVAMIATMLCSLLVVPASAKVFPDASGHWAQGAIELWSDRGVVNGDDAGNFRPGDPITRAETATLMNNLIGFQKTSNKVFADVATDAWYAPSINKLYAAGVLTGYEDGTIRPGNSISRQEAAVIIARAFSLDTKKSDQNLLASFADNGQIQDWARPTIAYMAGLAFVQGSDGMFRPNDPITRAEVVTILNNMVGIYADGSQSTYTGNYGDKIAIVKAPAIFNGVTMGGAVICGSAKGKINFNSGSKVSGCICNWSPNASVSTAGATVASTANKGGGTISAGGNFNAGYGGATGGGTAGGGGLSGGSSSGSSSPVQHTVLFYGNNGDWNDGQNQKSVVYNNGNSYRMRLPDDPNRTGYTFEGWYETLSAANTLESAQKLDSRDVVNSSSPKKLYAGWKKIIGLYGTISVATGDNVAGRGKSADELMDGVTLTRSVDSEFYQAKGGLRHVTGEWTPPYLVPESNNFLALTYTLPDGVKPADVSLTSKFDDGLDSSSYSNFTSGDKTYTRIFNITDVTKDIIFSVDLNGDGRNIGSITIDLSNLICYQFVTVTTPEEFTAAANNPSAEQITIDAPITLASGTYGLATRKTLVANHPVSIAKDAAVTLKMFDVVTDASLPVLFANTEETPEGETEPVTTKAMGLTLDNLTLSAAGVLNQLLVKDLVIKNSTMVYNGDSPATAISLSAPAEGDTVSITNTVMDGYHVALEATDATLFDGNLIKNNIFKNNTTDLKLGVTTAVPVLAYNYFDGAPVIAGTEGVISTFVGPLYTAETLKETDLGENLHDGYVYVDGVLAGKLSELDTLSLTFETEDATHEITLVPADARDTIVTINGIENAPIALSKADLPLELSIKVGNGDAETIDVSETVASE